MKSASEKSHNAGLSIPRIILFGAFLLFVVPIPAFAGLVGEDGSLLDPDNPDEIATVLEIVVVLTILSVAPAILILTTSFTRIVVVLAFLRRALATQQLPPNHIIIGLSLLLTVVVMGPTWEAMYQTGFKPFMDREISVREALHRAEGPMRNFMFNQTRITDVELMMSLSQKSIPENATRKDVPTHLLVGSFVLSELTRAFTMGFVLYLPFVVIDLVISTTLISMGMLVLPPILISLPFKILLFVLVDGWSLVVKSLVSSFYVHAPP